jgi:hypothetical protein
VKTGDVVRGRGGVIRDLSIPYLKLLTGFIARWICLTGLGVTARLTVLTGWAARRTLRGTRARLNIPIVEASLSLPT